ncbi:MULTISPECIES: hypothetical protein [Microbacterium]|uniref:hypothetical protein n=1 Tax=Microbacterium barkeri TaxID=33917 RepID=UPI0024AED50A|nr:hypothetical protein [Microbacterium barkeri]MDI6944433.1 hypothetical protein [Microbacterium barkeri]
MPTSLPRIQVTVTDAVAHALETARRNWPTASRSELIARLAVERAQEIESQRETSRQRRRQALARLRGTFDEAYPAGHLDDLREDWRE